MADEDQEKKINTSSRQRTCVSPRLTRSPKLLTENVLLDRGVLSTAIQTTIQRSKTGICFLRNRDVQARRPMLHTEYMPT